MNRLRVSLFGEVGELGGGLRVTADLLRLFRREGIETQLVCSQLPSPDWQERLQRWEVPWLLSNSADLQARVRGAPVVGNSNIEFLNLAGRFRHWGCQRVWVNCTNLVFPQETCCYAQGDLFEAYVFNSRFQREHLEAALADYRYRPELGHLIPDPFEIADWPFAPRPHEPDGEFVFGKLARADMSKWPRQYWELLRAIDYPGRRALAMGIDDDIQAWMDPPPEWATTFPPIAMPAAEFYPRLHCLTPINFACWEAWPRIGLEAMACGVPIIAPREGGWCDMLEHGETGFLISTPAELVSCAEQLIHDEPLRLRIIRQARQKVETDYADADKLGAAWRKLLEGLRPL